MYLNELFTNFEVINIILLFIAFVLLIVFASTIKIVPQGFAYIVARLGIYNRTLNAGIHFVFPFIEKVIKKVSLHEQTLDIELEKVYTKDNKCLKVNAIIYYVITDPKLSLYGVEDIEIAFKKQSAKSLRSLTNDLDFSEVTSNRNLLNEKLSENLNELTDAWGIKVNSIELNDINVC